VSYEERLHVPLRWWALLTMFTASVLLAFLVAAPLWVALAATAVVGGGLGAVFVGYGSTKVAVRGDTLYAGRASIPVRWLGTPVALDARASRQLAGVDADARAYLLLRPYVKQSVQVPVQDPADPAPYWMLSTRHPHRLVAAITEAAAGRSDGVAD
jgi:hypothetical protein